MEGEAPALQTESGGLASTSAASAGDVGAEEALSGLCFSHPQPDAQPGPPQRAGRIHRKAEPHKELSKRLLRKNSALPQYLFTLIFFYVNEKCPFPFP